MNDAFRQLPRILDEIEHFNMNTFGCTTECGTMCCLAGGAAMDPWMLENTNIGDYFRWDNDVLRNQPDARELAELFDITLCDAWNLFWGPYSTTKGMVRANIDLILEGKPAMCYRSML